ncbi:hypothetical protein HD595_002275 [Nonomuraea roseoviolacea subsp. carminata]|uniref:Uncharacterized protein n=1 Tax=Nonomuraea roseoviolacea subsp. carminata TaxID=160689 RepID=A0ABT1JWL9_9ACTN|nr:hypothetical protein [Nonomuraea roseoviolacea subsp. carminata]
MTDELLVVRAQLGDRAVLAELVTRWHGPHCCAACAS